MVTSVCGECGEQNDADATFCAHCHAYLRWDAAEASTPRTQTSAPTRTDAPEEQAIETTVIRIPEQTQTGPKGAEGAPASTTANRFAVTADRSVTVPATGEPTAVTVQIANTSNVVDGYRITTADAPHWLIAEAGPLELLPGTQGVLIVQLRIDSPKLVPAQQYRAIVRIQSMVEGSAYEDVPLDIAVPVADAPLQLRAEPRLVRLRDRQTAETMIIVDNSRSNRSVELAFSAADAELAVECSFEPEVLAVGAGAIVPTRLIMAAPAIEPGQQLSRELTVTAADKDRAIETQVTLQQSASAADPPVAIEVVPSLIRLHDSDVAVAQVILDNRSGRSPVRLWMGGSDPERSVGFSFTPPVVDVGAGRVLAVDLRLDSPRPEAGRERTRSFTVSAGDGKTTVEAGASLVQTSSRTAIETLNVGLDPSVLNLRSRRSGGLTAILDNRAGAQPAEITLRGNDPQNALRFSFSPPVVNVLPGRTATSLVTVRAPWPQAGREVNLPFDVIASDGRSEIRTGGSVIQAAADRRPLLRALFTLLGGLAMILGAFLPLLAGDSTRTVDVSAELLGDRFNFPTPLGGFEQLLTVGLIMILLGALVMIGLVGAKGRLSRSMAVLGLILVLAVLIAIGVLGLVPVPGSGAVLMILGCIGGYVGGRLVKS